MASVLLEMAARPLDGGLQALVGEIVLRLKGIDYVCRELAAIGIEPEQSLFEGGNDRSAARGNGAQPTAQ